MATTFVNMGRCEKKPAAVIVHAYEPGRMLPAGVFYGYVRGNRVSLYPTDFTTKSFYRGLREISIFDLKARSAVCT